MNQLLTVKRLAELLNCTTSSIYGWAKQGKVPSLKINGLIRFDSKEISEWLEDQRKNASLPTLESTKGALKTSRYDVDGLIRKAIDEVKDNEV